MPVKRAIPLMISLFLIFAAAGNASAQTQLSEINFEHNLNDVYGLAQPGIQYGGDPNTIVTYVPGHTGYAARTSHTTEDGGDDFIIELGNMFNNRNELYISFWVNYEEGYENCDPQSIWNIKWLWTLSADAHNEIAFQGYSSGTADYVWQLSGGGTGWENGNRVTKYGNAPYTFGQWKHVEIYFRLSSGATHMNPDGVQRLKINGNTVIEGTNVITGVPGGIKSPALKATCSPPLGHGWWQIDDYEVWDGIPGTPSAVCGNNVVETGEQCDDGNTVTEACAYGQTSCIVCSSSCQNVSGATSYCGDGFCDPAHENAASCSQDCQAGPVCGNGVIETGEQCDNSTANGVACTPPYGASCVYCSSSCNTVTLQGGYCGDGSCNGAETCSSCSQDCGSCGGGSECTDWQTRHPEWLFCDDFETSSVNDYDGGWSQYITYVDKNTNPANVFADERAIQATITPGVNSAASIYKFFTGQDGNVYARWYAKFASDYDDQGQQHFVTMQGLDPSKPCGCSGCCANTRPLGDDRYLSGLEFVDTGSTLRSYLNTYFYNQRNPSSSYRCCPKPLSSYAQVYQPSVAVTIDKGSWHEMELMIHPNTPGMDDGYQAYWIDGILVMNVTAAREPCGPYTSSPYSTNCETDDPSVDVYQNFYTNPPPYPTVYPAEGFIWRTVGTLKTNSIWIQVYNHLASSNPGVNRVWFDNLVVSREYVGSYNAAPVCTDADSDDYGIGSDRSACTHPELDCNDNSAAIHPGATEICNDAVDNDCDGQTDCADTGCSGSPYCSALTNGDLNTDGIVNVFDLVIIGSHYGTTPASPNWDPRADPTGEGEVDINDLVLVAGNFGNSY